MEITSGQPNVMVGGNGMNGDWGIMFLAFLAMSNNQQCCCQIKQEIAALNLENEKRFAALNQKMDANEIQRLRDQVQDLKSDVRMQGVFRMPQSYTFNAGPGPFAAAPLPPVAGFGI